MALMTRSPRLSKDAYIQLLTRTLTRYRWSTAMYAAEMTDPGALVTSPKMTSPAHDLASGLPSSRYLHTGGDKRLSDFLLW